MMPFIVVISLKSSHERRQRISVHLHGLGLEFEFFDAVDGDDADTLVNSFVTRSDFFAPSYTFRSESISNRELACTISHMRAISHVWSTKRAAPVLVLEDDAILLAADASLIEAVFSKLPADACYLQLALTPAGLIGVLAESYHIGGDMLVAKSGCCAVELGGNIIGCHSAGAYLLTEKGMRQIAELWFEGDRCIFPCGHEQLNNNVALVADRLVYHAATSGGGRGYVCSFPMATTTALDSTLHPAHVPWHSEARDMAYKWSNILRSRILSSLNV